jgi:hypothetical protein
MPEPRFPTGRRAVARTVVRPAPRAVATPHARGRRAERCGAAGRVAATVVLLRRRAEAAGPT